MSEASQCWMTHQVRPYTVLCISQDTHLRQSKSISAATQLTQFNAISAEHCMNSLTRSSVHFDSAALLFSP